MKNKKRKLGAVGYTFLALLGGVASTTIMTASLVSCNGNKDYYGKQKAVISSASQSGISIAEEKTLDNGDMQIALTLPSGQYPYFLQSAIIQANGASLKDSEFKVSTTEGIITIYNSTLKTYKTTEKFVVTPLLQIKRIVLDKTSIELGIGETATLKATLADGAKKKISAEASDEVSEYINIEEGEDENTLKITGLKSKKYMNISFSCDGYYPNVCTIDVVSKKDRFVNKADEFSNTFNEATTQYTIDKIKVYNETDKKDAVVTDLEYIDDGYGNRECNLTFDGIYLSIAYINTYSGQALKDGLKEETVEGVTYTISDNEITYHDGDGAETSDISINRNGYVTKFAYDDSKKTRVYKVTYTGDPQ